MESDDINFKSGEKLLYWAQSLEHKSLSLHEIVDNARWLLMQYNKLDPKNEKRSNEAIEFAEWLRTFGSLEKQNGQWVILKQISSAELYQQFLREKEQLRKDAAAAPVTVSSNLPEPKIRNFHTHWTSGLTRIYCKCEKTEAWRHGITHNNFCGTCGDNAPPVGILTVNEVESWAVAIQKEIDDYLSKLSKTQLNQILQKF